MPAPAGEPAANVPMTGIRREVVETAERVARDTLAPRAAHYDDQAQNPVESWRDLWRVGLLAGTIPTSHGGLGLDTATYISVIRALARGCASTAMTVHMHSTVMRFIEALGTAAQKRRFFGDVVQHGKLFGSWGSEPAVSLSRTLLMETVIRHDGARHVTDGVKHFCTMALGASHYMVWCALDGGTDMAKSLQLVLVPADAPGITTDGKWDTLGMRATFSPSVTFTGVRVSEDGMPTAPSTWRPKSVCTSPRK
jgi:alkylation response protein AidB-like acyl-CoA dehydrogenase